LEGCYFWLTRVNELNRGSVDVSFFLILEAINHGFGVFPSASPTHLTFAIPMPSSLAPQISMALRNDEKFMSSECDDIFKDQIEKDDPLWKIYIDETNLFDKGMIDEWNKIIDVILVFVSDLYLTQRYYIFIERTIGCTIHFRPHCLRHQYLYAIPTESLRHYERSPCCNLPTAGCSIE
jgi:hypothetical protein